MDKPWSVIEGWWGIDDPFDWKPVRYDWCLGYTEFI